MLNSDLMLRGTRPAVAAGRFYPREAEALRHLISELLAGASGPTGPSSKAIIAPHAGYIYSGSIAASAYAQLAQDRETIRRIVLLGPSHFVGFEGLATSSVEAFATPLGLVPVDRDAVRRLAGLSQVRVLDAAHQYEHALEVQLPFLQVILSQFSIVPLVAGEATAQTIAEVLESLWGGPESRFVISSDLSHYLDAESARRLDEATGRAIAALEPENLGENQACGRIPIQGFLHAARLRHLRGKTLDLRNSGDTAGPSHQVVGYGAFAFTES